MSTSIGRVVVLVVGIGLGAAWLAESIAHQRSDRQYHDALKARQQLELQYAELKTERDQLAGSLKTERQRVEQIARTLAAKDSELQAAVSRLAEEEHNLQQLQGELVAMQQQWDRIQTDAGSRRPARHADAASPDGMVQLEKVVIRHPTLSGNDLHGRVISVHPEWQFVVIDLGWDAVNIGDVVSIYRDDQLVGKARVDRVQAQVSAASLLPDSTQLDIHVNDVVRTL